MSQPDRLTLKILSILLKYPDEDIFESLKLCESAIGESPDVSPKDKLQKIMKEMERKPLLELQERYASAFDMNPSTSLALTYHRWGDQKERGGALAELNRIYREAGYEVTARELPDHLPLVLEFLSICPETVYERIVKAYGGNVNDLAKRLGDAGSPYAGVMQLLSDLIGSSTPQRNAS